MTEQRPDTDERAEPGGTPSPGPHDLIDAAAVPGADRPSDRPQAVPGAHDADEEEQRRGRAVKPGN